MMKKFNKINILVFSFLILFVFYPVFTMLIKIDWLDFKYLLSSPNFKEAIINSIFVTVISTIISLIIAYLLSFSINRTNIKHKSILKLLITIPMLIPSISHGLGLINLFGTNGIISNIFNFNVIGMSGVIIGSVLYSFPVAFLMINDGFNYIDNNMYDVAKILGLNKWQTFKQVTFCYLKKPFLLTTFAVFTMIFTDYGVPLAVGGKFITLPVFLYKEVIGLLDFSKGTIIGLFLLIPAFISFILDTFLKDYSHAELEGKKYEIKDNKLRDIVFTIITYSIIFFIFLIIFSFIYYAFIDNVVLNKIFSLKHFEYIINNDIFNYIFNSLFISIMTSILGTTIAYFASYITARVKSKDSKIIHILVISSLAIPGIVLGLSYTISFSNSFIYNTYFILIIVNIIHFISSPYLMSYNALQKINSNYELVAKTCHISQFKIIKDVIIPCTKTTIREMFVYFFVNSMITISCVAFLFNTKTMPLSLLINNYEGSFMYGEAAIISLIILVINCIVKFIAYLINRKESRGIVNEINRERI